ncbi:MAG: hypothetical protein H0W99_09365 [Acidobacteria bacterium]|nr:hypothetical protein [Acidobacteriota bacterium]
MSKYAVYDSSRVYHFMRDELHTKCGVRVFAAKSGGHFQCSQQVMKIVESVPAELQLCRHCSGENVMKKDGKK